MEDAQQINIELVTKSEVLGLNSWDRARSRDELISFISRREAEVSSLTE